MAEDVNGSLQSARRGLGYRVSDLTSAPGLKYWFGYFGIGFIFHPNCCLPFDLLTRRTLLLSTQVSTALVCGLLGAVVTSIIVIAAVAAVAAK